MTEATSKPISRRTVARGAAWTAPVILGGVAAPAYAASGNKPVITPGPACKLPGNSCNPAQKGYIFVFTIQNTSAKPIFIYNGGSWPAYGPRITTTPLDNKGPLPLDYAGGYVGGTLYPEGKSIPVPAGGTVNFQLYAEAGNSADRVFGYTVDFQWGHTESPAEDTEHSADFVSATVSVAGTPPCVNCQPPTVTTTTTSTSSAARVSSSSASSSSSAATTPAPATSSPAAEPNPTSTTAP